ncbi:MAG: hypothetical protein K2J32_03070 [Ruminococcus sp.]|nr:hypothetical protein [Ruminococcus sp.]
MIDYYLRMYLKKRKELENHYNSNATSNQNNILRKILLKLKNFFTNSYSILSFVFVIIVIVWIIFTIIFGEDLINYKEHLNIFIVWCILTVLLFALFLTTSFLDNKIKNNDAERKIQDYENMIKDLKSFFNAKGIDTDERRKKLLEDVSKEKKSLIEEATRPKRLLEKFFMGVIISTFIGTVPATIQGYMDNCEKEKIKGFIPTLIGIFLIIISVSIISYVFAIFHSSSYNKKIQQYKEFEKDLTEMLYIDDNIPQTVPATSP